MNRFLLKGERKEYKNIIKLLNSYTWENAIIESIPANKTQFDNKYIYENTKNIKHY